MEDTSGGGSKSTKTNQSRTSISFSYGSRSTVPTTTNHHVPTTNHHATTTHHHTITTNPMPEVPTIPTQIADTRLPSPPRLHRQHVGGGSIGDGSGGNDSGVDDPEFTSHSHSTRNSLLQRDNLEAMTVPLVTPGKKHNSMVSLVDTSTSNNDRSTCNNNTTVTPASTIATTTTATNTTTTTTTTNTTTNNNTSATPASSTNHTTTTTGLTNTTTTTTAAAGTSTPNLNATSPSPSFPIRTPPLPRHNMFGRKQSGSSSSTTSTINAAKSTKVVNAFLPKRNSNTNAATNVTTVTESNPPDTGDTMDLSDPQGMANAIPLLNPNNVTEMVIQERKEKTCNVFDSSSSDEEEEMTAQFRKPKQAQALTPVRLKAIQPVVDSVEFRQTCIHLHPSWKGLYQNETAEMIDQNLAMETAKALSLREQYDLVSGQSSNNHDDDDDVDNDNNDDAVDLIEMVLDNDNNDMNDETFNTDDNFYKIIQEKLGPQRTNLIRNRGLTGNGGSVQGFLDLGNQVAAAASTTTTTPPTPAAGNLFSSFESNLSILLANLNGNYWNLVTSMRTGAHGFRLDVHNCYDLWRYHIIKASHPKTIENTMMCIRKVVRIWCCKNMEDRLALPKMAKPGGLFLFLCRIEVLQTMIGQFMAKCASSTFANYIVQTKIFLLHYWQCTSHEILRANPGHSFEIINNRNMECINYLQGYHKQAKRAITQNKQVKQAIQEKQKNFTLPDIAGYNKVLEKADQFLADKYSRLLTHLEEQDPIFDNSTQLLHENVQNGMWAVRNHFLWWSTPQRHGQYNSLVIDEFQVILVEIQANPTSLTTIPTKPPTRRLDVISLDRRRWDKDSDEEERLTKMQSLCERYPTKYKMTLRCTPRRPDKRIRNKDRPWFPWHTNTVELTSFIIHFFVVVHPMIYEQSQIRDKSYSIQYPFQHTRNLVFMNERALQEDKVIYFNYHAKFHAFQSLPVKKACATIWRHAHATNEMLKFENQQAYQHCVNYKECANEIAFDMNTSAEEVIKTYSTRIPRNDNLVPDEMFLRTSFRPLVKSKPTARPTVYEVLDEDPMDEDQFVDHDHDHRKKPAPARQSDTARLLSSFSERVSTPPVGNSRAATRTTTTTTTSHRPRAAQDAPSALEMYDRLLATSSRSAGTYTSPGQAMEARGRAIDNNDNHPHHHHQHHGPQPSHED